MANQFEPTLKSRTIDNSVSIFLEDGSVFSGWESLVVTENLDTIANSFEFSVDKETVNVNRFPLKPGKKIRINMGQDRVINGFIEKLTLSVSSSDRGLRVSGRSKSGDLVDCSVTEGFEFGGVRIDKLAEALVKPFGLQVFLSVLESELQTFGCFAVKPGETVFSALDRAARLNGFLWVSTRDGNIRLTEAGRFRSPSEIEVGVNCLSATLDLDDTQRYSTYSVLGQSAGSEEISGALTTEIEGSATDPGISRTRPKILQAEGNVDGSKAASRAKWEASVRAAEAQSITCRVDSWRQQTGDLWGANQLVLFKSPLLGFPRGQDFLIKQVQRKKSNEDGTVTDLTLVRPDAFQAKQVLKEEFDLNSILGSSFQEGASAQ